MYRVRACNDGREREREREIGFLPRVVPTLYFVIARLYCNGDDSDQDERVKEGSLTRTSIVAGTTHLHLLVRRAACCLTLGRPAYLGTYMYVLETSGAYRELCTNKHQYV